MNRRHSIEPRSARLAETDRDIVKIATNAHPQDRDRPNPFEAANEQWDDLQSRCLLAEQQVRSNILENEMLAQTIDTLREHMKSQEDYLTGAVRREHQRANHYQAMSIAMRAKFQAVATVLLDVLKTPLDGYAPSDWVAPPEGDDVPEEDLKQLSAWIAGTKLPVVSPVD